MAKEINYLNELWDIVNYLKYNKYRAYALGLIVGKNLYKKEVQNIVMKGEL